MSPFKLDVAFMREALARLGINGKFKDTNRALAEFCSCRFWQLDVNQTMLGPKPGRVIPKLGWATNMIFKNRDKMYEHVRGIALGMHSAVNHIPILRAVINTILRITQRHASIPDPYAFHFKTERMYEATALTFAHFEVIYGITRRQVEAFEASLQLVNELPYRIDNYLIDRMVEVDSA